MSQKQTDTKHKTLQQSKSKFIFWQPQIVFCTIFVFTIMAYMLIVMLPELVRRYPPPQSQIMQSYLTPFLGWYRNSHDSQWQDFRSNLPTLILVMLGWHIITNQFKVFKKPISSIVLGMCILIYAYRADFLFYLTLLLIWYFFTIKFQKKRAIVVSSWIFCISFLYVNEYFDHLRGLSSWFQHYVPINFLKNRNAPILWTNLVNMSFLKLISFTTDCYKGDEIRQLDKHHQKCAQNVDCYQCRDLSPLPENSLLNFLEYMFFPPTLFTGPPIAYKNFHSFKVSPTKKKPEYIRWVTNLIIFELWQHIFYRVKPNSSQNLIEIEICGIFALFFIWFKFVIIWRTARLWALMMNIDVIDNMGRCIFNNYGFQKFWRMWHKGFNHWLIRYIYIPYGGSKNPVSTLIVIAFVSYWHDHTLKIIMWGFIIAIFMIPQFLIKDYFRKKYPHLYPKQWFKYLCAFTCGIYIQIICICNLIGFGYQTGEAQTFFSVLQRYAYQQIIIQSWLTAVVILMFYIRQIDKKND